MDRAALAHFLRTRRAALQPADVGLGAGARRRTAGLRREEVAQLAVMSTDYYTRLEQQRGPQPSTQMLAALARALRLTADERDYLYRVSGHAAPDRLSAATYIAPALQRVFDRLDDTPAMIISAAGEVLLQNRMGAALMGDVSSAVGWERFEAHRWFLGDAAGRYPEDDRDRQARAHVAGLRVALAADAPRAGELVALLRRESPAFARLWDQHEVAQRYVDHKVLVHPEIGPIEVDCQVLFTEDRAQALLVLTAAPGSADDERLALLGVVGTQRLSGRAAERSG